MHHEPATGSVELGVWVVGDAVGAGVAAAICRALIAEACDGLGVHRITWQCAAGNRASERLATRRGFRHEGTLREAYILRGERRDLQVFGRVGDEIGRGPRQGRTRTLTSSGRRRSSRSSRSVRRHPAVDEVLARAA
jgi:RimJ/RimL family protein N-acetyltransferase